VDLKDKWRTMLNQAIRNEAKQGNVNEMNKMTALNFESAEQDEAFEVIDQPKAQKVKAKSIRQLGLRI
jgi:hypothetical protein